MKKLIEVKIDSLRVSLTNQQRIVVLKQVDDDRYLPIWIGPYEAEAITIALQEIEVSRPQTHDLLYNLFSIFNGHLLKVIISELKDDIFYGTLLVEKDGEEIKVDCRPSDAIAIAVRAHVPIMVSPKVMDEASIIPEEISPTTAEEGETEKESPEPAPGDSTKVTLSDERLSVFEDYFSKKPGDSSSDEKKSDHDKDDDLSDEESK